MQRKPGRLTQSARRVRAAWERRLAPAHAGISGGIAAPAGVQSGRVGPSGSGRVARVRGPSRAASAGAHAAGVLARLARRPTPCSSRCPSARRSCGGGSRGRWGRFGGRRRVGLCGGSVDRARPLVAAGLPAFSGFGPWGGGSGRVDHWCVVGLGAVSAAAAAIWVWQGQVRRPAWLPAVQTAQRPVPSSTCCASSRAAIPGSDMISVTSGLSFSTG